MTTMNAYSYSLNTSQESGMRERLYSDPNGSNLPTQGSDTFDNAGEIDHEKKSYSDVRESASAIRVKFCDLLLNDHSLLESRGRFGSKAREIIMRLPHGSHSRIPEAIEVDWMRIFTPFNTRAGKAWYHSTVVRVAQTIYRAWCERFHMSPGTVRSLTSHLITPDEETIIPLKCRTAAEMQHPVKSRINPDDVECPNVHGSLVMNDGAEVRKSELWLEEVLRIAYILEIDCFYVAAELNNIGVANVRMQKKSEALELFELALQIMQRSSGVSHAHSSDVLINIGHMNMVLHRYDVALLHFEAAKRLKIQYLGPSHIQVAEVERCIAETCYIMGDLEQAIIHFQKGIMICETQFGPTHITTVNMMESFARMHNTLGDYNSALKLYQSILKSKLNFPEDETGIADTLHNTAVTFQFLGDQDSAMKLFQEALAIYKGKRDRDLRREANTLKNIGTTYCRQRNYAKAIASFTRALEIESLEYGLDHPNIANTFNNMGIAFGNMGRTKETIQLCEAALHIVKRCRPDGNVDIAGIHYNFAMAKLEQGKNNLVNAGEHLTESYKIFSKALGNDHRKSRGVKDLLDAIARSSAKE